MSTNDEPLAAMRSPMHRSVFGLRQENLLQYGLAAMTAVLVITPLLPLLYQSLIDRALYDSGHVLTLQNYRNLFTNAGFGRIVFDTLLFAFGTTLIAQIVGVVTAILVGRTDMPGRRLMGGMLMWPLFISTLVMAFGWFMIYGPSGYITLIIKQIIGVEPWSLYSIAGMAVVAGVSQAPLTFLYCLSSTSMADPSLEDAARSCGARPMRTLWSITIPLLAPAILYSASLNFVVALETLSVPLIFGEPVGISFLTSFLFTKGLSAAQRDYGLVGTAAVLLLAVVCLLVFLQNRFLRNSARFVTVGGKAARPRLFKLGALRWPAAILTLLYILLFVIFPIGILFLRAFVGFLTPLVSPLELLTLRHFTAVFSSVADMRAIWNTILVSFIGGVLGTLFITGIAFVVHRSKFRFRRELEYVALFPRAVPGIVAGIGFFYAMVILSPLGALRNTIWILVIAYIMRYIPLGFSTISPSLLQVSADFERSARIMGASWWTAITRIMLRLIAPAMMTCFTLLFVHFLKEYSTAIFLYAPGSEVIGTSLLTYYVGGLMGEVAVLASIQIVITVIFVIFATRVLGVRLYG